MTEQWKQMQRVRVEVEPDLIDLIPDFLARKRTDLQTLNSALEADDLPAIAALGHKIKGDGGNFGFEIMREIGSALQAAGKKPDRELVRQLIVDLSDYLQKVEVVEGRDS